MAHYLDEYPPNPYAVSSEIDYPDRQPTTKIVRKVDKYAKQRQDEKQAVNRKRHLAIGKSIYGALRFLPYLRYVTDVMDIAGLSPDVNSPDFTDAAAALDPAVDKYVNKRSKNQRTIDWWNKHDPFRYIGIGGDIAQEYNNLKELYNLYK